MGFLTAATTLYFLLAGTVTAFQSPDTVFLEKQQASSLISRQKRNQPASNLEKECMEKLCTYDEARRFFQDTYRTDIFWSVYVDGDQCVSNPCQNGALCSDSVGGYDCVCKSGFSGAHCEKDETLCTLEKDKGCSQFCKPGYASYECSCAQGWRVSRTDKNKCEPAVTYPCGKVNALSLSAWEDRKKTNVNSNFQGLSCTSTECPWQALLRSSESAGYCSGVILKNNLVLTSAQCANKYKYFQVVVGKRTTNTEDGEQSREVKLIHIHPSYVMGRPEYDLAVVVLRDPIVLKREVIPVCLPEKDFADNVLMTAGAMVTGWKESQDGSAFQGELTLNHLDYDSLANCVAAHTDVMTNKMGCTTRRPNADCSMSSGSPLVTLHRDVFFLTGVITKALEADCTKGYTFQKVSRHLGWLQPIMGSS